MRQLIALLLLAATAFVHAATGPYDEAADAHAAVRGALVAAAQSNTPVLVVFGANWCPDCRVLDMAMHSGSSAPLMQKNFRVVKVDVGRFDRNVDLAEAYGVPLKKGIPAVAVLSPQGKVLYATRSGELADARELGEDGIYRFFSRVAAPAAK